MRVCVCVCVCRKIDNKIIQMEGKIYWEVDTIAFRFYWTIVRIMRGDISDVNDGCLKMQNTKTKGKFCITRKS